MKEIKTIDELKEFVKDYEKLRKINKRLHKYYELNCTYGLTSRQQKNCLKLEKQAQEISEKWGFLLDLCTDPRGIPICLKENKDQFRYAGLVIPL